MQTLTRTAQKMKFSIKDFLSKCDQICSFLRIWSLLLKKSIVKNFIFLCSDESNRGCVSQSQNDANHVQGTCTCSKSTIERLEKGVKYVQS